MVVLICSDGFAASGGVVDGFVVLGLCKSLGLGALGFVFGIGL